MDLLSLSDFHFGPHEVLQEISGRYVGTLAGSLGAYNPPTKQRNRDFRFIWELLLIICGACHCDFLSACMLLLRALVFSIALQPLRSTSKLPTGLRCTDKGNDS